MGRRVAIVGGGISGLSLAERLVARGADPLVLEAGASAGGKVQSLREGGYVLEAGPNGFLDREPATVELAGRLGISGALRAASSAAERRWIHLRGRLRQVPAKPPELLRSDLLPLGARLRLPLEVFSRRVSPGTDESIADFGRRHIGRAATRDLLASLVVGIFAGDAERLSLPSCFPRMAALEAEHRSLILAMRRIGRGGNPSGKLTTCEGGLGTYVAALAASLGDRVRTGAEVAAIERAGARWRVHLQDGDLEADAVVITTPASSAARLLGPVDAALGDLAGSVPYAPVAVVHLGYSREAVPHPLDGFGWLAPPHENRPVLGVLFISSIFPFRAPEGRRLFTAMVGGDLRPELAGLPENELVALVREELALALGVSGEPELARVVRWDRAIPQYRVGHGRTLAAIDARLAELPGLYVSGSGYRGVGFNDCVAAAGPLAARVAQFLEN